MFEKTMLEKVMEEERRRQELLQDLINPPWKRMLETHMTAEDRIREQSAAWSSRCAAMDALGKSALERVESMTSAFEGGIDRILKMTAPAQASIANIVSATQGLDAKMSAEFSPLKDMIDRTVLGVDSAMDKLGLINQKLSDPIQFQLSVSPAFENTMTSLSKMFDVGRSIADESETLYGKLTASQIGLYGNLWEKNFSPAFAGDAVGFMTDFIGEVEDDEPEDALAVVRETVEYLKEHAKEFPVLSPKQAGLIGIALCQFAYVFDYISQGIKAGTLSPESGTIQIVWLYFTIVYTICELKKKE